MNQQGDILLYQTPDDGEINVEDGLAVMSPGLETTVYLSLFGGNEDDDGRPDNPFNYWGNIDEILPERQYHSETQNLLKSLPATSAGLRRIEAAAERDLAWLLDAGVASSVVVSASIPGVNRLDLLVLITADGEEKEFTYSQNWKASA